MPATTDIGRELETHSHKLADSMDRAFPFRPASLIDVLLRDRTHRSSVALIPLEVSDLPPDEQRFTRTWLERPITRREKSSPISLLRDTVLITGVGKKPALHDATPPELLAVAGSTGWHLELKGQELWTPVEAKLERVQLLASYVTAIEEETFSSGLKTYRNPIIVKNAAI